MAIRRYKNFKKKVVVVIGPYPGRIGGVSIFVKRLHQADIPGVEKFVLNTQNFSIPTEKIYSLRHLVWLLPKSDLIHINISNLFYCLIFSLMAKFLNKKIIVQFHSLRYEVKGLKRLELRLILKFSDKVITVNGRIADKLLKYFPSESYKIRIIPAFISPNKGRLSDLPAEIVSLRRKVSVLIVANAFKIHFHEGNDLYGLGLSMDMFNKLILRFPSAGFVFIVLEPSKEMYEVVSGRKMPQNFLLYEKPVDFMSLLKISDIFVRPTFSDGDSLSVREALSMGVPTIASNAVKRPEPVILFNINNPDDFLCKIEDVITNMDFYKNKFVLNANKQKDYPKDIRNLYFEVLRR